MNKVHVSKSRLLCVLLLTIFTMNFGAQDGWGEPEGHPLRPVILLVGALQMLRYSRRMAGITMTHHTHRSLYAEHRIPFSPPQRWTQDYRHAQLRLRGWGVITAGTALTYGIS